MATARSKAETESVFDLDQWLGGASRPEREVRIHADNRIQAEIAALFEERDQVVAEYEPVSSSESSWGGVEPDPGPDTRDVDRRIRDAQKRLAASAVVFRVRAIDADEMDAIIAKHPFPKGASAEDREKVHEAQMMERLAVQVVEPQAFTTADLQRIRRAVGEPEFMKLWKTAVEVNADVSASSPFWRGNSGNARS